MEVVTASEWRGLSERMVDIWILPTGSSDAASARFERVLAPDEKARSERFCFPHLRKSFITTRGALRYLLGRYLSVSPANIEFHYGSKGKPALAPAIEINFNVTHSADFAAFAFTLGCQIGIDLEHIHAVPELQGIASRYFCREEAAEIAALPPEERESAFFRCWTRKEAYIKAIGDGLSAPLNEFRVTLRAGEPSRFVHLAHDTAAAEAWTLHDLRLAPGYTAALAYCDRERPLSRFHIADAAELLDLS
jgi:4'-phosphopantetheinyl transferase